MREEAGDADGISARREPRVLDLEVGMRTLPEPASASGHAVTRQAGLLAPLLLDSGCSYLFVEGPPTASAPPGGP